MNWNLFDFFACFYFAGIVQGIIDMRRSFRKPENQFYVSLIKPWQHMCILLVYPIGLPFFCVAALIMAIEERFGSRS